MRSDMYKVIVERPRRGGGGTAVRSRTDDPEQAPSRESLLARHRSRKRLNENLRPLQRYLATQVGRPWNKVYADICAHIDRRNTVQQHIHEHLNDLVAVGVVELGGVRRYDAGWFGMRALSHAWAPALYVDPDSGLLLRNRLRERAQREHRAERARKAAPSRERRDLDALHQLHRIDGLWYWVELAPVADVGDAKVRKTVRDAVRRVSLDACPARTDAPRVACNLSLFGRADVYAARKRQLGARDLHRYGLRNDGNQSEGRETMRRDAS